FFEGLGVALKEEDHGRMFPVSNSAKSVVQTLVNRLHELGVVVRENTSVQTIEYGNEGHLIHLQSGEKVKAKAVVLAVGGKSVPHTGSTGDGYPGAKQARSEERRVGEGGYAGDASGHEV